MYWHILKKDLKRKKTMNVILLLFIALATMFVASSVSNIMRCLGGIDDFFQLSHMQDFVALQRGDADARAEIEEILQNSNVSRYDIEEAVIMNGEWIYRDGKPAEDAASVSFLMPIDNLYLTVFDESDQKLNEVAAGTAYIPAWFATKLHAKIGDKFEIRLPGHHLELTIAGCLKDAMFGSPMLGNPRILVNQADYDFLLKDAAFDMLHSRIIYASAENTEEIEQVMNDANGIMIAKPTAFMHQMYLVDVFVAAILLVVSICLILIAVVVLKFTVTFTLNEEFREIGVMKAIGIESSGIRKLYLVKYLAISIVGGIIGFFASMPFGAVMKRSISEKMILSNHGGIWLNLGSALLVVLAVSLFSWWSTARIRKSSPLDAIRTGETGERYGKKKGIRLAHNHLSATLFSALNDVLSAPKRYLTLVFAFVLCLSLVLILSITADTFEGSSMIPLFHSAPCDAYIQLDSADTLRAMCDGGEAQLQHLLDTMHEQLTEQNIPAETFVEVQFTFTLSHGEKQVKERAQMGFGGVMPDEYTYLEGTPPCNAHEVAISTMMADRLAAGIGDTIQIHTMDGIQDCLVTAVYDTLNNLGLMVRIHPDMTPNFSQLCGVIEAQIRYTDSPDAATIAERFSILETLFGEKKVMTAGEFCASNTGVGNLMHNLKFLVLLLAMLIVALVTVLMERSFIAKEKSEIALMKAIGFHGSSICRIHMLRFLLVSGMAALIADILTLPLTKLCITPIFRSIGAVSVDFVVNPLLTFLIYPCTVILITALASWLTALTSGSIHAADTANIE